MSTKKQTTVTAESLPSGDLASYQERPRRKPDRSSRGTLKRWSGTDYGELDPTGAKESNRTMIKQVGPSSFCKNEGLKESSYSIHINVDGSSADPVNEAREIFNVLTAEQAKQKPTLSENGQGRMLFDNGEGLQIWHDTETNKLTILTQLECTADIERQLLQAQAQMNVVLGRNRKDLINNSNNK